MSKKSKSKCPLDIIFKIDSIMSYIYMNDTICEQTKLLIVCIILIYLFVTVKLRKNGEVVGIGKVMPDATKAHGYQLTQGWVSVEITQLFKSKVACWADYPTFSDEIEEGSFSAWPTHELITMGNSGRISFPY